jgi:hypothetical protein
MTRLQALYQIQDEKRREYVPARQGILNRGDTGFEIRIVDGETVHVCHSDEIGWVLEFLETEFPSEFAEWRRTDAQRRVE